MNGGQPVVDSQGKLLRTDTGVLITYTEDPNDPGLTADTVTKVYFEDSKGNPIYHHRRDPMYNSDGSRQFYSAGDVQRYFGDEPRLFFGGEVALYTNADHLQVPALFYRLARTAASGQADFVNIEALEINLGSQNDVFTIVTTPNVNTVVNALGGADTVNVRGIGGATVLNLGDGDDNVQVGSQSGLANTLGTLNQIAALLTVNGDANTDITTLDDTGDSIANTGTLTSTTVEGIFGPGGSLTYATSSQNTLETLQINLGPGGNTFNVRSVAAGATNVQTGSGSDTINIGSVVAASHPTNTAKIQAVAGTLTIDGQRGADTLNVDNSGDTANEVGTFAESEISGLGMAGKIDYKQIETLLLWLGSGNDKLYVASTDIQTTTIDTGSETIAPSISPTTQPDRICSMTWSM